MRPPKKKCLFCGRLFITNPRVEERQKSCSRKECRRKRKARAQKKWLKQSPDYYRDRYGNTRDWLDQHPGYLNEYRRTHPEYTERNRIRSRERKASKKV